MLRYCLCCLFTSHCANTAFVLSQTIIQTSSQNKEAEAKEELKRRVKQLGMQRRTAGWWGSSYLGGGVTLDSML